MVTESVIGALKRHFGRSMGPTAQHEAPAAANHLAGVTINAPDTAPFHSAAAHNLGHCGGGGGDESSKDVTPIMSALPSSANLLSLKDTKKTGHVPPNPRRLQRQISECISLPQGAQDSGDGAQGGAKGSLLKFLKLPCLLLLLYLFICSLDFLSTAFRLIAGKAAGELS